MKVNIVCDETVRKQYTLDIDEEYVKNLNIYHKRFADDWVDVSLEDVINIASNWYGLSEEEKEVKDYVIKDFRGLDFENRNTLVEAFLDRDLFKKPVTISYLDVDIVEKKMELIKIGS